MRTDKEHLTDRLAVVHRKKPDRINDPGPLLRAMLPCRKAMIDAMISVKPMGTAYHALSMVVSAIDALATLLIGREGYFWATGSTPVNRANDETAIDRKTDGNEGCNLP
jgi:hypothetical protein